MTQRSSILRRKSVVSGLSSPVSGFTLVELLVVCAIIVILASLVLPGVESAMDRARFGRWVGYSSMMAKDSTCGVYYTFDVARGSRTDGSCNCVRNIATTYDYDKFFDPQRINGHVDGEGGGQTGSAIPRKGIGRWGKEGSYFDGFCWVWTGTCPNVMHRFNLAANPPTTFTSFVWVKLLGPGESGWSCVASNRRDTAGNCRGFTIYAQNGGTWQFWTGNLNGWDVLDSGQVAKQDLWTCIAITFKATGPPAANGVYPGTKRIYINGRLVNTNPNGQYIANDLNQLDLGTQPIGGGAYNSNCIIDEFAIFARTFTDGEVAGIYNMGKP